MKRLLLTTASLAIVFGLGAAGASAANITQPAPGAAVYGPLATTPPAGEVAPGVAPPGFQYQWVYSYDHHGYHGHWEAVRIGS
jgi:hypothetical protein